jgi:predicted acylesterase/phospholipase RssA
MVENNKSKVYDTLVLSGASTKGFLLLGALQYSQDNFLLNNIHTYIGTSVGSIISYLLIIGYTPIEMMVYICTHQILEKMQNLNLVAMMQGNGAVSFHPIHETLEKMTIDKIGYLPTLEDLYEKYNKKLICVTHNITENKTEYLSHTNFPKIPCLTAIRMSANLPLFFEHYRYGKSFYIDGGISDNFAIQLADKNDNKVLGINLEDDKNNMTEPISDINILEYLYKLMIIPISQATDYKISQASDNCSIINLTSNKINMFDFNINSKTKLEMFTTGYTQAESFYT